MVVTGFLAYLLLGFGGVSQLQADDVFSIQPRRCIDVIVRFATTWFCFEILLALLLRRMGPGGARRIHVWMPARWTRSLWTWGVFGCGLLVLAWGLGGAARSVDASGAGLYWIYSRWILLVFAIVSGLLWIAAGLERIASLAIWERAVERQAERGDA